MQIISVTARCTPSGNISFHNLQDDPEFRREAFSGFGPKPEKKDEMKRHNGPDNKGKEYRELCHGKMN
jgi:hypothetical protein